MQAAALVSSSIAGVFISSIAYVANIFAPRRQLQMLGHAAAAASLLLLSAGLALMLNADRLPLLASGRQVFSFIAWALLAVQVAQALRWNLPGMGAAMAPLALAALFVATALPGRALLDSGATGSHWLYLHVISIVVSLVLLLVSGSFASVWLVQDRMLKAKRYPAILRRFPPLEVADNVAFVLASVGFAALSIGVLTATVWVATHPDAVASGSHPVRITAAASWALYAVYLWARSQPTGKGWRANWVLVAGCVALLLTTSLHRFLSPGLLEHHPSGIHSSENRS